MVATIGVLVLVAGLVAWVGQGLAFFLPEAAVRLGVLEPEDEIDPTLFVVETRAMGLSDLLLAWTLPASAFLMLVGHPSWPYLALIGSGIFAYFSFVTSLSRFFLKKRGKMVGRPTSERAAYVAGAVWIVCSLAMITLAVAEIRS